MQLWGGKSIVGDVGGAGEDELLHCISIHTFLIDCVHGPVSSSTNFWDEFSPKLRSI